MWIVIQLYRSREKTYLWMMFEHEYSSARWLINWDISQLWAQHMYRPSALVCSIRNMCASHISSMWTKAIEPILALTADSIEKNLVSPAEVAKITSYQMFSIYAKLIHVNHCFTCGWYNLLEWFIYFYSRKPYPPESVLCGSRWASKTSAVPGSYKRCTPWLELETCCADLKSFVITPRCLKTFVPFH